MGNRENSITAAILGLPSFAVSNSRLKRIYKARFAESRREREFLASVRFLASVLVVRGITITIHNDIGPFHDVQMPVAIDGLPDVSAFLRCEASYARRLARSAQTAEVDLKFTLGLILRDAHWIREGGETFQAGHGDLRLTPVEGVAGELFFEGITREIRRIFRIQPSITS